MTTTERKRLSEHVTDALDAFAQWIYTNHPDRIDDITEWRARAHEKLTVEAHADIRSNGRIDTRSAFLRVYLDGVGPVPMQLCELRARNLCDADGQPIDARQFARDCLYQHGHGIPDDPGGLTS